MRLIDGLFENAPLGMLYHYTGFSSLLGMQRTKELWAGSIHYMNDTTELVYACDVIEELLAPQLAFAPQASPRSVFARELVQWISRLRGDTERSLFIFSLSEAGSLLSQWRSYTPHGKGVSIGISSETLRRVREAAGFRLGRCIYRKLEQQQLLQELYEMLWTSVQQPPFNGAPNLYEPVHANVFDRYANEIYQTLALIKHEAFSEEREWRLISPLHYDLANCEFRDGTSMLIPYIAISTAGVNPAFETVVLGPTPHRNLSLSSLFAFLSKHGLSRTTASSDIPYREW